MTPHQARIEEVAARSDRRFRAAARGLAILAAACIVAVWWLGERGDRDRDRAFLASCLLAQEQARLDATTARVQSDAGLAVAAWHRAQGRPVLAGVVTRAADAHRDLADARTRFARSDCRRLQPPPSTPVVPTPEVSP